MNKQRRIALRAVHRLLVQAQADIEQLRDDEQIAFDNMPESLQSSDRGQRIEDNASVLSDVLSALQDIDVSMQELDDSIDKDHP